MKAVALFALLFAITGCAPKTASIPEWKGVWIAEGMERDIDGFTSADPNNRKLVPPPLLIYLQTIPWNDNGKAKVQSIMAASGGDPGNTAGNAPGWGYPLMMIGPGPLEFLHMPGRTVINNLYRDTRQIYTDGRGHLPAEESWPATTWGDSIGNWEGDTLVIDTIGVRNPFLYFSIAAPFSEKAHYKERLRLVSADRIEGELTVEDPETLTRPVTVKLGYVRSTEIERLVLDSFSNDRSGWDGKYNTIESAPK